MKYLLMTYGVLMILFSGALTAKASGAEVFGSFSGELESPTVGFLGPCTPGLFVPGVQTCSLLVTTHGHTFFPFTAAGSFTPFITMSFDFPHFQFSALLGSGENCDILPGGCVFSGTLAGGASGGAPPAPHNPGTTAWVTTGSVSGFVDCFGCVPPFKASIFEPAVFRFSEVIAAPTPDFPHFLGTLSVTVSPVPEPGSFSLFAIGLLALLWVFRRQAAA